MNELALSLKKVAREIQYYFRCNVKIKSILEKIKWDIGHHEFGRCRIQM